MSEEPGAENLIIGKEVEKEYVSYHKIHKDHDGKDCDEALCDFYLAAGYNAQVVAACRLALQSSSLCQECLRVVGSGLMTTSLPQVVNRLDASCFNN